MEDDGITAYQCPQWKRGDVLECYGNGADCVVEYAGRTQVTVRYIDASEWNVRLLGTTETAENEGFCRSSHFDSVDEVNAELHKLGLHYSRRQRKLSKWKTELRRKDELWEVKLDYLRDGEFGECRKFLIAAPTADEAVEKSKTEIRRNANHTYKFYRPTVSVFSPSDDDGGLTAIFGDEYEEEGKIPKTEAQVRQDGSERSSGEDHVSLPLVRVIGFEEIH